MSVCMCLKVSEQLCDIVCFSPSTFIWVLRIILRSSDLHGNCFYPLSHFSGSWIFCGSLKTCLWMTGELWDLFTELKSTFIEILGSAEEFLARVDIEVDSPNPIPVLRSVALRARAGVARIHAPRDLQVASSPLCSYTRVSRLIPLVVTAFWMHFPVDCAFVVDYVFSCDSFLNAFPCRLCICWLMWIPQQSIPCLWKMLGILKFI